MSHFLPALRRYWSLCCLLLAAGCHTITPAEPVLHGRRHLQPPEDPGPALVTDAVKEGRPVPICLDTVLRLAQDRNGQVRLARMKVADAETDQVWADKHWLPDLYAGMGAFHHSGGIQDFQGNLLRSNFNSAIAGLELGGKYDWKEVLYRRVEAERKVWTQRGELSKLSSDNLLDASTTYIDLLSAQTGSMISRETEGQLRELLTQAKALAKVDPGLRVEVSRIETELMAQSVLTVKLREASKAASSKLAYLLGLHPCCEFIVADKKLVPISIVNVDQPTDALVEHALTRGPGVRELEGLLHTVETARNANYGWSHWMPSIEMNVIEGSFGASPAGDPLAWANRFDVGVRMRWNLSEYVYAKQRRHQADANIQQAHLSLQDLKAKLTLGVQEARDAIHSGREQLQLAERHITFADESYKLSNQRLQDNVRGRSTSEVLLAMRTLSGARLEYVQAVRDLDKANLRLFVLVGALEANGEQ